MGSSALPAHHAVPLKKAACGVGTVDDAADASLCGCGFETLRGMVEEIVGMFGFLSDRTCATALSDPKQAADMVNELPLHIRKKSKKFKAVAGTPRQAPHSWPG